MRAKRRPLIFFTQLLSDSHTHIIFGFIKYIRHWRLYTHTHTFNIYLFIDTRSQRPSVISNKYHCLRRTKKRCIGTFFLRFVYLRESLGPFVRIFRYYYDYCCNRRFSALYLYNIYVYIIYALLLILRRFRYTTFILHVYTRRTHIIITLNKFAPINRNLFSYKQTYKRM